MFLRVPRALPQLLRDADVGDDGDLGREVDGDALPDEGAAEVVFVHVAHLEAGVEREGHHGGAPVRGGVAFGDPLLVTPNSDITPLVRESSSTASGGSKLIFWDRTAATADATYAALENVNVHLRGGRGYYSEKTGELVTDYARKPHSPAINAGDPRSDYRGEPQIPGVGGHGHRVNLGAYGNTPWATLSAPSGTMLIMR